MSHSILQKDCFVLIIKHGQDHSEGLLLFCYHEGQGHSEGLYNQNMILSAISSELLIHLQPNLVMVQSIV